MAENEIFVTSIRLADDWAGVFEYADGKGYFYLYEMGGKDGQRIADHIWVVNASADFEEADVTIRWDTSESRVGLFIRQRLWALFDLTTNDKFGGGYQAGADPGIPDEITRFFSTN